jgi:methylenetetrahydrofolate dehydrogenase (NADP+)/methenyltetrahydrofolate cyclohydrolase
VCIATLLVSDDPRDEANARRKHLRAKEAGMQFRHLRLPAASGQREVESAIDDVASDPAVHGVFVQLPLPSHIDENAVVDRIPPEKDIDGLGACSLAQLVRGTRRFGPATPRGIIRLLERHDIALRDARAVVIGRSVEIARALVMLLANEGASVTLVDPDASNVAEIAREADVLVSAAERPHSVATQHVKRGAVVVDAGYNRTPSGVVGDVDVAAIESATRAIVAMPDGIGPATIATLLENTWSAARRASG